MHITHSLPVQNELASLVNHVTAPRSSSFRAMRPRGLALAQSSNRVGFFPRKTVVILQYHRY